MKKLKVALVHDYIKEYGGAERVLEALREIYPDAPVFTSVYLPRFLGPHQERFKNWNICASALRHVPFKSKLISPFRLIAPFIFSHFDLSEFDVVIVSATGTYCPNFVRTKIKDQRSKIKTDKKGAIQVCYCHTPPRYLYGYATARDWKKNKILAVLGALANHFLRMADFTASKNVDCYIANSQEVASRIEKFYRREATVIYPPVDIHNIKTNPVSPKPKTYYLTGGRLARAKHTDLIVQACQELNVPLKVFGRGFAGYDEELKDHRGLDSRLRGNDERIEFLGEVSDEEKLALMSSAKAFIFAGEDEDFGILPVEAMSAGLPVIAHKSGGVKETIIDGRTGLFFNELTVDSVKSAIKKFDYLHIKAGDCIKQAEKFSKERFIKEIKTLVNLCSAIKTKIFEI